MESKNEHGPYYDHKLIKKTYINKHKNYDFKDTSRVSDNFNFG